MYAVRVIVIQLVFSLFVQACSCEGDATGKLRSDHPIDDAGGTEAGARVRSSDASFRDSTLSVRDALALDSETPETSDSMTTVRDARTDDRMTPAAPLTHCLPSSAAPCESGSICVEGCPSNPALPDPGGICSVPGRETCGCGAMPQPCTSAGLDCLMPSCCDYPGLCVTPDEKDVICGGPDALRFDCVP